MDEKGFLLGVLQKMRRIFSLLMFESGQLLGASQDGIRTWITLLACICMDGTCIPPAIIFQAQSGDILDTWLKDFEGEETPCAFASSPSGWTNENLGYAWLTKVFDKYTKEKARQGRDWRLLFVDGHLSYLNMRFLNWCNRHRIYVAIYPPHSTHRL